jgi:hypothetical protein
MCEGGQARDYESEAQMNTTQSPTQPEFFAASLLVKPSAEAPAGRPANPKGDRHPERWSWASRLAPLALGPYLIAFCIGVAAALAWQSYGGAAREIIAPNAGSSYQEQFNAISIDLNAMRQGIDRIATNLDANQEQIRRSVDQLAASHELITRDFSSKLEAVEHNILDKISMPAQRPAAAPHPVARPPQVPMVRSGIP